MHDVSRSLPGAEISTSRGATGRFASGCFLACNVCWHWGWGWFERVLGGFFCATTGASIINDKAISHASDFLERTGHERGL